MNDNTSIRTQSLYTIHQRLLDISKRNQLLNYKEKARTVHLIDMPLDQLFKKLMQDGKSLIFVPQPICQTLRENAPTINVSCEDLPAPYLHQLQKKSKKLKDIALQTAHNEEVLARRCKKLAQEARSAIEETGNNLLYLAVGFLEWYEDANATQSIKAPLILIPVKLERTLLPAESTYDYVLSYRDEGVETNIALSEKLANDFNLALPLFSEEILPATYLEQVASVIQKIPRWQVVPTIRLDFFSFTKLVMYKDLDNENWPDDAQLTDNANLKPILGDIPFEKGAGGILPFEKEEADDILPLILDADSSQQAVIMAALRQKKHLVVEGPPGTGKSQTITNLIAAALSEGQSVLFVAEKKAALDVVAARLDKAGLGEFCLELHSHKTQKAELHANLKKRLDQTFEDVIQLEGTIQELKAKKQQLQDYANLVNTIVGPHDERIYDVFWALERLRGELADKPLPFEIANPLHLSRTEFDDKINNLQEIGEIYDKLSDEVIEHWHGFQPTHLWPGDKEVIRELLSNLFLKTQTHEAYLDVLIEETQIQNTKDIATLHLLSQIDKAVLLPLPSFPDSKIALQLLEKRTLEKLRQFQTEQKEYRQLLNQAVKFLGYGKYSIKFLQQILNSTNKLEKLGFGKKSPDELAIVIKNSDKLDDELHALLDNPESVNRFLRFLKLKELAEHAPQNLVLYKLPEHALEATPIIFQQAHQTFSHLTEQWAEQKPYFLLNKLPNSEQIAILSDEIRKHQNNWFPILSSEYRRSKSAVKSFLATSKFNNSQLARKLEALATLKRKTEQETQSSQYQRLFGPLFCGLETDWAPLEQLINWAQMLTEVLGTEEAQQILAQQSDPCRYILKTTALKYEQWLRVTKAATQLNITVEPHLGVNEFVEKLLERRRLVAELAPGLQRQLPHLTDKKVISLQSAVQNLLKAWQIRNYYEKNQALKKLLGKNYQSIDTEAGALFGLADWITRLQTIGNLPASLLHWIISDISVRAPVFHELLTKNHAYLVQFSEYCRQLAAFGELDIQKWFKCGVKPCTLEQIATTASTCQATVNLLGTLSLFYNLKQDIDEIGLSVITEALIAGKIQAQQTALHYQYAFYQSLAREVFNQHPILAKFTRIHYETLRQQFTELDKQLQQAYRQRIAYQVAQRAIPQGNNTGKVSSFTEKSLIEHELNKKRRHIPIRQLVRRATKALQALKPCFMMSPLSVAQYLAPGQIEFDLLIMDEASQIRPEDALGAIARSQQIVIVGDPKQLPPTPFFERLVNEEEESTIVDGQESILDMCFSLYSRGRLRWHYRSQHENLIAFSNHHFYDDELIVFPAPRTQDQEYGLHLNYIEKASYLKGRNQKEAETVVTAIVAHLNSSPHLSLGIATFNLKQQELITELLDKQCQQDTGIEEKIKATENTAEPFFIKNLENVQGDERDVIFVSTTYGPDPETGKVFQRFGPISNEQGWRRLNVIFTRAKKRLALFTALRASDIVLKSNSKRGVHILKSYLEYAETGHLANKPSGQASSNDFEIAISKILQEHGYQTVAQVGVAGFRIELGVCHPSRPHEYLLGIEYDGANYHATDSIRDRDRLRQEILESKGWKLHRIWSADWYQNREIEIERLLQALAKQTKVCTPISAKKECKL